MGIKDTQYRNIMYRYDQTRMKNKRLLDKRIEKLYKEIPELKEIHDAFVEASLAQARLELSDSAEAHKKLAEYETARKKLSARKKELLGSHNELKL